MTVMGEVLEHVEQPAAFLVKLRECTTPGGLSYLTTCVNGAGYRSHLPFRSRRHGGGDDRVIGVRHRATAARPLPDQVGRGVRTPRAVHQRRLLRKGPSLSLPLRFHHLGLAVRSTARISRFLRAQGYQIGELIHDPLQNVQLAMCRSEAAPDIELITPAEGPSPIDAVLKRVDTGIYHLCYEVESQEGSRSGFRRARAESDADQPAAAGRAFRRSPRRFLQHHRRRRNGIPLRALSATAAPFSCGADEHDASQRWLR